MSADLFGMTTTNTDDLNIGQVLERAIPYFDYIAPMVYPSHYPNTFIGLSDPNKYPYEVVKYSLDKAVARMVVASTTPAKIRPWLQVLITAAIMARRKYAPRFRRHTTQGSLHGCFGTPRIGIRRRRSIKNSGCLIRALNRG